IVKLGSEKNKCNFELLSLVLQNDIDLLNPPAELEKRKHKLKRLVQSPNSFFMAAFNITTVFSHSQTVVVCGNCQTVLCQPTGGKARLTEGCSFFMDTKRGFKGHAEPPFKEKIKELIENGTLKKSREVPHAKAVAKSFEKPCAKSKFTILITMSDHDSEDKESLPNSQSPVKASMEKLVQVSGQPPQVVKK
uniref:40S ribosomal protein S27 n=1 Tax=Brassica oleracea var. oleracea TaxID=109376 RepID=A0A0D3BQ60_BRAOL